MKQLEAGEGLTEVGDAEVQNGQVEEIPEAELISEFEQLEENQGES